MAQALMVVVYGLELALQCKRSALRQAQGERMAAPLIPPQKPRELVLSTFRPSVMQWMVYWMNVRAWPACWRASVRVSGVGLGWPDAATCPLNPTLTPRTLPR